jgi:hypothetical protein
MCFAVHGAVITSVFNEPWEATMTRRIGAVALSVLALAACSKSPQRYAPASDQKTDAVVMRPPADRAAPASPPMMLRPPPAAAAANVAAGAPAPAAAAPISPTMAPSAPMLAYEYQLGLTMPAGGVRAAMERHQKACEDAGPLVCQVTNAQAQTEGRDIARATLQMRAVPDWLKRFREGIETDAKREGGRLTSTSTSTEDLTRSIVDTEATNRARVVLRDRLERLLAERPGDLSDVMALQQQIAAVQGQIDAAQSELEVMRSRVAMSDLTLNYIAEGVAAPEAAVTPLAKAGQSFISNMLAVLAVVVTLLSFLLPLALIAAPVVWLVIRYRQRLPKPAAAAPKLPPAA